MSPLCHFSCGKQTLSQLSTNYERCDHLAKAGRAMQSAKRKRSKEAAHVKPRPRASSRTFTLNSVDKNDDNDADDGDDNDDGDDDDDGKQPASGRSDASDRVQR